MKKESENPEKMANRIGSASQECRRGRFEGGGHYCVLNIPRSDN